MKPVIIISLLFVFIFNLSVSAQDDSRALYQSKVEKFKKMRNGGIAMTIGGAVLTAVGIASVSNADWHQETDYNGNQQYTTNDGSAVAGMFAIAGGVTLVSGGIVLAIIGNNKMKKYQQKLNGLSFNFKCTPQQKGFVLSYRF
jgi:hypothetical protein